MLLSCADKTVDLGRPQVMGILNVTPDSFSDGGRYISTTRAIQQGIAMVEAGAGLIDVGGESTRPGAGVVGVDEELARVIPVIEGLVGEVAVPVSIDTMKPEVMRAAVAAGAGMINDVMALQSPGSLEMAASLGVPVCLMHMQGTPRTMQASPHYRDVVKQVIGFFHERVEACGRVGISREQLLIDPGFGFGKTLAHNQLLLKHMAQFRELELPLLVGISRKSMIGAMLNDAPVDQRLAGSLAAAVMAYERGAAVIRVHDVKQTVDALRVASAVLGVD